MICGPKHLALRGRSNIIMKKIFQPIWQILMTSWCVKTPQNPRMLKKNHFCGNVIVLGP